MVRRVAHPSVDDRKAKGLEARDRASLLGHSGWKPATDRPDPVDLLVEQETTREPDLIPVRHGRMMVSPFTFYRGAAKIMAADLAGTPVAGLEAQLCGDAHLSNFGGFASPERVLLFDVNDFDETLPGPFEYDVKRMAASFTIAARNNGFSPADTRAVTLESVRAYRAAMASFAQMRTMDLWYAHLDEDELRAGMRAAVAGAVKQEKTAKKTEKADKRAKAPKKAEELAAKRAKADREDEKAARAAEKRADKTLAKAHTRDSTQALSKLGELVNGTYRIVSQPPIVVPARDLAATYGLSPDDVMPVSMTSSAPTGPPCKTTGASCSSASRSWTRPARWSAWAASGPGVSSSCSRDATPVTRCSCRSRRRRRRCLSPTSARAGTGNTASGWCRASG
jgi:uncharacterized protein DUF2252